MNSKELYQRIKRLEDALSRAGRPYSDYTCECCHSVYVPPWYDSCRCNSCCSTCKKVNGQWVKGHLCPDYKLQSRDL